MYEHMVFFKFNDQLTAEKEAALLQMLQGFQDKIPGITGLTAGRNETDEQERMQGYTLGLRVTFEDKAALDHYITHPEHVAFLGALEGVIEDVVVMDYPIT
ncbi:Dabb family protein [Alkalicoccus chagannorensis]|uniref:Dabb family protein n=1 Tax=Alkalicoccus chagannorensis TaxID=427072 RepID=UPI00041D85A7|nr:Dabb family protein [Alkalicoccus chagannorensis]